MEVPTRPPSPLPEEPQTAPTAGMVWIAGYWSYGPTPQPIWTWIPGHWLTAPEGERWVAARTTGEPGDARYRFQPGAFCK